MKYYKLNDLITYIEINKSLIDISLNLGSEDFLSSFKTKLSFNRDQIFAEVHSTNTIEGVL